MSPNQAPAARRTGDRPRVLPALLLSRCGAGGGGRVDDATQRRQRELLPHFCPAGSEPCTAGSGSDQGGAPVIGCYDFCGHYEWTFDWLEQAGGKALLRAFWEEGISKDSQLHARELIARRGFE